MAKSASAVAAALLCLTGCAGGGAPTFERFDLSATPPASRYPDVPAAVLLDRGLLTFGIDPARRVPYARLRRYRRIKVLRPEGRDQARVTVPYDPNSVVTGLVARAVYPDGRVVEASGDIRDVVASNDRRQKLLVLPEVDVGTVVEHTYDLYIDDLRFLPAWVFQGRFPTIRSEYAVLVPEGFAIDLRFSRDGRFIDRPPERFEVEGATRYSWSMADLPPRFAEADMPNPDLLSPRAHVLFRSVRIGEQVFNGFRSWDDVATWQFTRFRHWDQLSEATASEARRIAGNAPPEDRALKLTEVIARDLKSPPGAQPPFWRAPPTHPDALLAQRFADPTGRGMLLVALLRAVNIPAVPALAAYRGADVLVPDAATVRAVDAVVAVVPRPGAPLILDPGQLTLGPDLASPRLQQTRLIVMRPTGTELLRVPRSTPESSRCEVDFQVDLDQAGVLSGRLDARLTGAEAGALRTALMEAKPQGYAQIVSTFLKTRGFSLPLESVIIADLRALRRPLTLKARIRGDLAPADEPPPNDLSTSERSAVPSFIRVGAILGSDSGPLRPTRQSPLLFSAPRTVDIQGTLGLPEGYEVDALPPPARHRHAEDAVTLQVRTDAPRRIGLVRRERWSSTEISPRAYARYVRFREALRTSEAQAFSVRADPDSLLLLR